MKHSAHFIGRTISRLMKHIEEYIAIRQIRNGTTPSKRKKVPSYGYPVKRLPLINEHQVKGLKALLRDLRTEKESTLPENAVFKTTDRVKILEIIAQAGYSLVGPLYNDPDTIAENYKADQQIQFFAVKDTCIPGFQTLRYAILVSDCWTGKKAFTLSCAIVHDTNFQTTNAKQIIWKEYIRIPHRAPHLPFDLYKMIDEKIRHFEKLWTDIRMKVMDKKLMGNKWEDVVDSVLQMRTAQIPYNPLMVLQRYDFPHYDALGNLYFLWAMASGGFRVHPDKKYTRSLSSEELEELDKQFMDYVKSLFP